MDDKQLLAKLEEVLEIAAKSGRHPDEMSPFVNAMGFLMEAIHMAVDSEVAKGIMPLDFALKALEVNFNTLSILLKGGEKERKEKENG